MAELAEIDLVQELEAAYERYQGYQCHWTNWRALTPELLTSACRCIPRAHLLAIWERMLFDPRECRRGFPDLVAFGDRAGEYRLLEVKGPGDTLQDSQRRWLRFFQQQGVPAAVVHVRWQDD